MAELHRGSDHDSRIAALRGFQQSIESGVDAGLAQLGPLNDRVRVFAALQLLIQNDRFQDAADLVAGRRPDCKWVEQAIYAYIALKDLTSARQLLTFAFEECDGKWVSDRCRLFTAEAAFTEVLKEKSTDIKVAGEGGISDEDRAVLNLVIEVVEPLIAPVRATGHIDGALQRAAVEFVANAYGMLGQMSKIRDLANPMANCHPLPLLLAQLTLRGICEPRDGLSGRIRVEHSENFSALLLAAILDREIYDRGQNALSHLLALKELAIRVGTDSIEQLCQVLFETASSLDLPSMAKARSAVDDLLGTDNPFCQYFDAVAFLMQQLPQSALATLDAQKRHDHGVWWQIAAKAHELNGDPVEAAKCWEKACQMMPHPDLLDRFAGFSVQQHRFEDAVRALKVAVAQSPENPRLMERLAFAHSRLREFSEAAVIFRSLVQIEPTTYTHRINLAVCESRIGNPQLALDVLTPIIDLANPDLRLIAFRTELLNSLDRANDAFADLEHLAEEHWRNPQFLVLYLDTAYRSGNDKSANAAFRQLLKMQHGGELVEPVFQPVSLDDIKKQGLEYFRRRDDLHVQLVKGELPWLAAEALLRMAPEQAWHRRTQSLRWLNETATARGEWNIYSTNGFSVQQNSDGGPTIERIGQPGGGDPVVADMSSIITLHRLGRLAVAVEYLGRVILPVSLGNLAVRDARHLLPHQPSRERELRLIRDLVNRRLIEVLDPDDVNGEVPIVDEYGDEEQKDRFVLRDVYDLLRSAQILSTQELDELSPLCHRPPVEGRNLPNSRVIFEMSVLRTLAEFNWLERIVSRVHWCVLRDDYEDKINDLVAYEFQRDVYRKHEELWEEIRKHLDAGFLEYRNSPSCRATVSGDGEEREGEPPPFFDAVLLANDLGYRLLADDRFCQSVVLNQSPAISDAAFGTDRLLVAIEGSGRLQTDEVLHDFLQLMRWRYRFLLPEPRHLKSAADHSKENLPGPELREIAAYVQDSMRDPGLFCGLENADPPTPMAFNYFMVWKRTCVEFLAIMWEDSTYGGEQLSSLTVWCIQSLFPAVPRGMLYTPVGRRMADFVPKAFLIAAMVRFATVQPLKRANDALRIMADAWGLSPDEFYEAAAEAADDRLD